MCSIFRVLITTILCVIVGCSTKQLADHELANEPVPHVITADIQAGIEKHIEDQTRQGGGYFKLPHDGNELRLKLVKVHTEYLANLGPRRHFACVDLASTEGNVYDVDFFLAGDPGSMTVTETTVHKVNGQPLYVWDQKPDKTWVRGPVKDAPAYLLGVITDSDEFEFRYRTTVPEITEEARMWIPLPMTDQYQKIKVKSIVAPGEHEELHEIKHGNRILYLTLMPQDSGKPIDLRFYVQRREKTVYEGKASLAARFLAPERLVPLNDQFDTIAAEVVAGKKGELVRARALYDHTIERMRYAKFGKGWGNGDAIYACDSRHGNCTDYHAYFIALSRASGIPARFAIGAAIPSQRDNGGVDGYHCWAEFYAEGKWWPVDISEADKCSGLESYYFGRHPANRVELTRGRDLVVEPGPISGEINFLAYPVLEVDGKLVKAKVQFSFVRTKKDHFK